MHWPSLQTYLTECNRVGWVAPYSTQRARSLSSSVVGSELQYGIIIY